MTETQNTLTQDEIDYVLCRLSRGTRTAIIEYFRVQPDKHRRVSFVKDTLGNGGALGDTARLKDCIVSEALRLYNSGDLDRIEALINEAEKESRP